MRALTFLGFVREDGSWDVDPGFVVDVPALPDQRGPGAEPVQVIAHGRSGLLASTTLSLAPPCDRGAGPDHRAPPVAAGIIDYPAGTVALEVQRDDRTVWEQRAPHRRLDVSVEWPGGVQRGPVEVRWDPGAEGCLATLGWSADGGKTTLPVVQPTASGEITADLTLVAGGDDCRLQLVVTDGWSTRTVTSDPLSLTPGGWRVWVFSPTDGAVLQAEGPVLLSGQAYQLEEHVAADDLTWTSSLSGGLGGGARVLTALGEGNHVITARHGDAQATVEVSVRPP